MARMIIRMLGSFGLGVGISYIIKTEYKIAAYILLVVSILFFIVYIMEMYCKENR